jgi:hypothetical protein
MGSFQKKLDERAARRGTSECPEPQTFEARVANAQGAQQTASENALDRARDRQRRQGQNRLKKLDGIIPPEKQAQVAEVEKAWRAARQEKFPGLPTSRFMDHESRAALALIEEFGVEHTSNLLRYAVVNWDGIKARHFKKGGGGRSPALSLINAMRQVLSDEAFTWTELVGLRDELVAWHQANPTQSLPEGDLYDRWMAAIPLGKEIGFVVGW